MCRMGALKLRVKVLRPMVFLRTHRALPLHLLYFFFAGCLSRSKAGRTRLSLRTHGHKWALSCFLLHNHEKYDRCNVLMFSLASFPPTHHRGSSFCRRGVTFIHLGGQKRYHFDKSLQKHMPATRDTLSSPLVHYEGQGPPMSMKWGDANILINRCSHLPKLVSLWLKGYVVKNVLEKPSCLRKCAERQSTTIICNPCQ